MLAIENLRVGYQGPSGVVKAIDGISLSISPGEFVCIVGESGSGKTTLGLTIIGLLPQSARPEGRVVYDSTNLLGLDGPSRAKYRGTEIGMIFQEPGNALNPIEKVGWQLEQAIGIGRSRKGRPSSSQNLHSEALDWLRKVHIADPERVCERYPFQLSGGMCQRVLIALTLSQNPAVLLADEPTSALDVTTQAQILKLMKESVKSFGTTVILVTHDLGVAAHVADRTFVLYRGHLVEEGFTRDIFKNPSHPYTQILLRSYPRGSKSKSKLETLSPSVGEGSYGRGCKFAQRCPMVRELCINEEPRYVQVENNHYVKCNLYY